MSQESTFKNQWEQLYHTSKELKQASSGQEMFSDSDISTLKNFVKNILSTFLKKGELHQGIKVYLDRELNQGLVQDMAERLPREDESIEEWCHAIFGDNKFGVVFNSLESYDNKLAEKMCTIVQPLLEKAGLPLGGLSFLFFMGNYGFTPFGIHKEAVGEEGFLFHLGPGEKTFYTWDIEEYNKIAHNTQVYHDVEEMLPMAESYHLKPKSVMFIPNHLYHIANTDEFSLSVVMDYINPSRAHLEHTIAAEIASQSLDPQSGQSYLMPIPFDKEVNWDSLLNSESWENQFKSALERKMLGLKSNSGVLKPALVERGKHMPNVILEIIGKVCFPIIKYSDNEQNTFIFARGHIFPTKPHPSLSILLSDLNNGKTVSFQSMKDLLFPVWDLSDVLSFINDLWVISAIELT